jgi:putative transposase
MLWILLAAECDELALVDWEWQATDGWLGKARSGGDEIGPNPADRAKNGTKKSVLTDANGALCQSSLRRPTSTITSCLMRRSKRLSSVIESPKPTPKKKQNMCLDKGYDNKPSREVVKKHGYQERIRQIGEERLDRKGKRKYPARRYVVERTLA